ncbi:MAG: PAS domain S-box protein [Sphingomonadales bacterium]
MVHRHIKDILKTDSRLLAISLVLAVVIFAMDVTTPLGVAGGVPYVALVLAGLWARSPYYTYVMAVIGTLLTIVGFFISPEGGTLWVVLTNRALAIFAIWVAAILAGRRIALEGQRLAEEKQKIAEERQKLAERRQRAAEEGQKESTELLQAIMSNAADSIVTIDEKGLIQSINPAAEKMFGWKADALLGQSVEKLMPKSYRDEHAGYLRRYLETGRANVIGLGPRELVGLRKDGSELPIELSLSEMLVGGRRMFAGIISDITLRKDAEEKIREAQKMDAIGQLTGGIAHEFNNLLQVVIGNLQMIEDQLGRADPLMQFTAPAVRSARRGADLTQSLLAFSSKQRLEVGVVDLNRLILRTNDLLERVLGVKIDIQTDLAKGLWPISADAGQIEGALLNFAINARDAMPEGGTIAVKTYNLHVDDELAAKSGYPSEGNFVVLEVADAGCGMSQEVVEHAFEPFFTTKDVGKGTGLGLSVAYGFATQSGGRLEIESEEGVGTTVRLSLPQAEASEIEMAEEPLELTRPEQTEGTILVLEDEPDVRLLVTGQLQDLGYKVFAAVDGAGAMAVLEEHPEIDLLFADVVLPGGKSGPKIAAAARLNYPGLKVLFTSGYPDIEAHNRELTDLEFPILRKPYPRAALVRAVGEVFKSRKKPVTRTA